MHSFIASPAYHSAARMLDVKCAAHDFITSVARLAPRSRDIGLTATARHREDVESDCYHRAMEIGQFTLSRILLVMCAVAVLCAVAAPWFNSLSARSQWVVALHVVMPILVLGFAGLLHAVRRQQVVRNAGGLLLQIHQERSRLWKIARAIGIGVFVAIGLMGVVSLSAIWLRGESRPHYLLIVSSAFNHGIMFILALQFYWIGRIGTELREHGVVQGFHYSPWKKVQRSSHAVDGEIRLRVSWQQINLRVSDEQRECVEQILNDKLSESETAT